VYNNSDLLKTTLISILSQTYRHVEIIVGDNASTENIEAVLDQLGREKFIYYKNQINLGYSGNCNKLISTAKGKYVCIYHSDDVYSPTIVEEQVKCLEANPAIAAAFTSGEMINEKGSEISNGFILTEENMKNEMNVDLSTYIEYLCTVGNILPCPTSMVRKEVYEELGGYSLTLNFIEDMDMWIRILERYNIMLINKELFKYRKHSKQGSNYYRSFDRDELAVNLRYLRDYLNENDFESGENLESNLRKIIAADYNSLVKNSIYTNRKEKIKEYQKLSLQNHKFKFPSKGWLLQNGDKYYIKLIIKMLVFCTLNAKALKQR